MLRCEEVRVSYIMRREMGYEGRRGKSIVREGRKVRVRIRVKTSQWEEKQVNEGKSVSS